MSRKSAKKILIVLSVALALIVPVTVFAAASDAPAAKAIRGFFGIDMSKLTDKQKSDVEDYVNRMAQLQKEFIDKMVENGALSREQGDIEKQRIDESLKDGGNGLLPEFGKIFRMDKGGAEFGGRGMLRKPNEIGKIDLSKLTAQQKNELDAIYKKMADLQKDLVRKMTASKLLTEEEGNAALKKIDEHAGLRLFMGDGFMMGCLNPKRLGAANLTEQQKADLKAYLKEYSDKMSALHKDLISKLTEFGVLVKNRGGNGLGNAVKNGISL